jgi:N6-adenosine-specific RNA methylase IME4
MGNCPRGSHELSLVCTRGKSLFTRKDVRSVQKWHGRKQHSAKPDGFFDLAMTCSPGPYLSMFERRQRLGWDTWGDEALCHVDLSEPAA